MKEKEKKRIKIETKESNLWQTQQQQQVNKNNNNNNNNKYWKRENKQKQSLIPPEDNHRFLRRTIRSLVRFSIFLYHD